MGLLDKLTKRFAQNATTVVKTEVKKTAIDMIPAAVSVASAVVGFFMFRDAMKEEPRDRQPAYKSTSITTNNYFFQKVDDELVRKIFDERRR